MVMSCIVFEPPRTKLEIGQETNSALRSMSVTSTFGAHILMYRAAVAPP